MIVSRSEAGQIVRGELTELKALFGCRVGALDEIRTSPMLPPVCTVKVEDCWPHNDGNYIVMFSFESEASHG